MQSLKQPSIATSARRKTEWVQPITLWAALGALFVALQVYVFGAWISSDSFRATEVGPDPIPSISLLGVWVYEVLSLATLIIVIPWFIIGIRKTGKLDHFRLLMIGFLATYWSDPWLNFLRPMFTYNAYAFNRGCWCEFIPFWQSANGSRIAEPLLIDAPAYFFSFAGTVWAALWSMRKAQQRWPGISHFGLGLTAFAGVWISMGLLDVVATRVLHFDAWPGAFHAASFWGGEFYQFPIYEFLLFPTIFVVCAFLIFRAAPNGEIAIERGIDALPWQGTRAREAVRILAFVGLCNMLNLGYTTALGVHALGVNPWPANTPSWLANEQCGTITGQDCAPAK
jgi:hypothetical protein